MSKNKTNKKSFEFEFIFNNVSVCRENKFKPFVEILIQEAENITQQNLGTLFGIFEISEYSEDSSYITNYLISVIKKEYFSRPKRSAIESFETALHKANLALSKLAEHGNINWIGKINIICAVLEKYNLHLTQVGSCRAFLLRNKNLSEISEKPLLEDSELNPLKTFTNVSSGKIENSDKIIVTTDNIFDIFSPEEIKKSANKFSKTEFIQFLRTAIGNELEKAATLVVDVEKKIKELPEKSFYLNKQEEINAFSSNSFTKIMKATSEKNQLKEELEKEIAIEKDEFQDKKTGHIYIKEAAASPEKAPAVFHRIISGSKNVCFLFFQKTGWFCKNIFQKIAALRLKIDLTFLKKIGFSFLLALKYSWAKILSLSLIAGKFFWNIVQKSYLFFREKLSQKETHASPEEKATSILEKTANLKKLSAYLPDFSKLKNLFIRFSYEQKIYAIVVILLIFFVPYIGLKIEKSIKNRRIQTVDTASLPQKVPLQQDKNVFRMENLNEVQRTENEIEKIINLNGHLFAINSQEILNMENQEKFSFSGQIESLENSIGMDDLNLILLFDKNKQVFSFSPLSKKIQQNALEINSAPTKSLGTYLTYLYVLDAPNSQIYRYPRAEGGFGAGKSWLKENVDLSPIKEMAVNENIFIAEPEKITKLFKGKKQDFTVEETATPIYFNKICAPENTTEIYILDKINSRIIQLSNEGKILRQFYNEKIGQAKDMVIKGDDIYFNSQNVIYSFSSNQ
jgi:hypothetical protein